MKIKDMSLKFILICFLLLFSFCGYCLAESNENIDTYENPDIDYNAYRYFTFVPDKLSSNDSINEIFQTLVIENLEDKNYIYVEKIQNADFIILLHSSNRYEKSSIKIPVYDPGKKIKIPLEPSVPFNPPPPNSDQNPPDLPAPHPHVHIHHAPTTYVYLPGDWDIETITEKRYYPSISITCLGKVANNPEIIWQGQGIKFTGKSNLEKYGWELIKEILDEFPEISERVTEKLLPIKVEESTKTTIEILLEQLK